MPTIFTWRNVKNSALVHRCPATFRMGKKSYLHTPIRGYRKLDGHLGLVLALGGRLHRHNVFWYLRSDLAPEFSHGRRNNSIVIGADDRYGVAHFFGQVV